MLYVSRDESDRHSRMVEETHHPNFFLSEARKEVRESEHEHSETRVKTSKGGEGRDVGIE